MVWAARFVVRRKQELAFNYRLGQNTATFYQVNQSELSKLTVFNCLTIGWIEQGSVFGSDNIVLPTAIGRGIGSAREMGNITSQFGMQTSRGKCLGNLEIWQPWWNDPAAESGSAFIFSTLSYSINYNVDAARQSCHNCIIVVLTYLFICFWIIDSVNWVLRNSSYWDEFICAFKTCYHHRM